MNPTLCFNILAIAALLQIAWTLLALVIVFKCRRGVAMALRSAFGMFSEYPQGLVPDEEMLDE